MRHIDKLRRFEYMHVTEYLTLVLRFALLEGAVAVVGCV